LSPVEYFSQINVIEIDLQAIVRAIGDSELMAILDRCLAFERPTYSSDDPPMKEVQLAMISSGRDTNTRFTDFYHRVYVLMAIAAK